LEGTGHPAHGEISLKMLLSHHSNGATMGRFGRMLEAQLRFAEALDGVDRVFVTDHHVDFDPGFPVIRTSFMDRDRVCLAAIKNVIIDYAIQGGYDWLMDGDADRFLARRPTMFPPSGYAPMGCYCSSQGQTVNQIVELYRADRLVFPGSFFNLLSREVFKKHRFCEEYIGYGFEDVDYRENVLAANGIHEASSDARGIHLWHPQLDLAKRYREHEPNKEVYRARQWAVHRQEQHTLLNEETAKELDRKANRF
jgi:hypothetical protein